MEIKIENLPQNLQDRITIDENGCWVWNGCVSKKGYGRLSHSFFGKSKSYTIHRLVYLILVGPIPKHLEGSHICSNRRCCFPNENHVIIETHQENLARRKFQYKSDGGKSSRERKKKEKKAQKIKERFEERIQSYQEENFCKNGHLQSEENTIIQGVYFRCKLCVYLSRKIRRDKLLKSIKEKAMLTKI